MSRIAGFRALPVVRIATVVAFSVVVLSPALRQTSVGQVSLQSSNLPVLIVDTQGQAIRDEPKIMARMLGIDNGPDRRNAVTDPPGAFDGMIGIEFRGSSSLALFPKKSFALETRNADGSNLNVSLLSLPTENDWVLHGPYSDKTLLRNVLAFHLARSTGRYASRWRFVELIINDSYQGVYVLLERVKRDNDRVDISRIESTDIADDAVTGGYILKIDKTDGAEVGGWFSRYAAATDPSRLTFYQYHYPKPSDIVPEQEEYIRDYIDRFEDVMASDAFADSASGYATHVDVSSLIDYMLLTEVTHNVDGYRLSMFFYKDRDSVDGRLVMGPAWDYNLAFGNANYYDGGSTSGFRIRSSLPTSDVFHAPFWWTRFLEDETLTTALSERWEALRAGPFATDSLILFVDGTAALLEEAQERNFRLWPVLDEWIWPNVVVEGSWESEIAYLKSWLTARLIWLDENMGTIGSPAVGSWTSYEGNDVRLQVYPNPATAHLSIDISIPETRGRIRVLLYDALGRQIATLANRFVTESSSATIGYELDGLAAGVYYLRIEGAAGSAVARLAVVK